MATSVEPGSSLDSVGAAKARELYYLSERVDAKEAERLGLVNWVVPDDALEERTLALARQLASGPTVAYRYIKENIRLAMTEDLFECLDLEATHHLHTGRTEDHREAAKAFVEKRTPVFKGTLDRGGKPCTTRFSTT